MFGLSTNYNSTGKQYAPVGAIQARQKKCITKAVAFTTLKFAFIMNQNLLIYSPIN